MASFQNNQQTDLASILRTLASHAPPPTINAPPTNSRIELIPPTPNKDHYSWNNTNYGELAIDRPEQPVQSIRHAPLGYGRQDPPTNFGESRSTATPPLGVDPHAIISWPPALRHVSKMLARNEAIADRIRKLIKSQHDHEKQWLKGRDTLLQLQKNRVDGRSKVADVLRAVGGHVDPNLTGPTRAEDLEELARYDSKVHRACTEMVKAMRAELIELGIPFFGTKASLLEQDPSEPGFKDSTNGSADEPQNSQCVTSQELLLLQKRMLDLLEDLSKD